MAHQTGLSEASSG